MRLAVQAARADARRIRRFARLAALVIFAGAVAAAAVHRHVPAHQPGVLHRLGFAANGNEVRALAPPDVRPAILRAQTADSRVLIPAYWALFTCAGLVMMAGRGPKRAAGAAVIVSITIAAACDALENAAIDAALTERYTRWLVSPAPWAAAKWLTFFLTSFWLSVALFVSWRPHPSRMHATTAALLLMTAGLLGAWPPFGSGERLSTAVAVMVLGLFFLALLLIWDPEYVTEDPST